MHFSETFKEAKEKINLTRNYLKWYRFKKETIIFIDKTKDWLDKQGYKLKFIWMNIREPIKKVRIQKWVK